MILAQGVLSFKTHSTDIPTQSNEEISGDENKHFRYLMNYKFYNNENRSLDEYLEDDGSFLSAPQVTGRHDPNPDFSVIGQHSRKGFKLLTGRKYRKQCFCKPH